MKIAPLSRDEMLELGEILASFGVYGSRFHETRYNGRPTKGGSPQPKGSDKMQTVPRAQYDALKAKADALRASLNAKAPPVRFAEEKYGLNGPELVAIRQPKAAEAIAEYASDHHALRRAGLSLSDYVKTSISDVANDPLPSELSTACDKLQGKYGMVADLSKGGLLPV